MTVASSRSSVRDGVASEARSLVFFISHKLSWPSSDKIKVDRSFVMQMGTGLKAAAIVSTVVALGFQILDLTITAEGVETEQ